MAIEVDRGDGALHPWSPASASRSNGRRSLNRFGAGGLFLNVVEPLTGSGGGLSVPRPLHPRLPLELEELSGPRAVPELSRLPPARRKTLGFAHVACVDDPAGNPPTQCGSTRFCTIT